MRSTDTYDTYMKDEGYGTKELHKDTGLFCLIRWESVFTYNSRNVVSIVIRGGMYGLPIAYYMARSLCFTCNFVDVHVLPYCICEATEARASRQGHHVG